MELFRRALAASERAKEAEGEEEVELELELLRV